MECRYNGYLYHRYDIGVEEQGQITLNLSKPVLRTPRSFLNDDVHIWHVECLFSDCDDKRLFILLI